MPKLNSKNLYKRGGVWWLKVIRDGKLHRESTRKTDLKDAIDYRDEQLAVYRYKDKAEAAAVLQGKIDYHVKIARELEKKDKKKVTFSAIWNEWLATAPSASEATLHQYSVQVDVFKRWIAESHPKLNPGALSPEIARSFVRYLEGKKRSANTINKYIMLLRQIWSTLFKGQDNPWVLVERRSGEVIGRRPLTKKEISAVLKKADPDLKILIMLGALLGMRLGDACTMKWQSLDLTSSKVTFKPRKTRTRTHSTLVLSLPLELKSELEKLTRPAEKDDQYVLPKLAEDYLRHPSVVTKRLQKLFTDCGITTLKSRDNGGRNAVEVGFHSLRHSLATSLAEANVPHAVAQEILGHASPALLRTYQHVGTKQIESALSKAAKKLKTALK